MSSPLARLSEIGAAATERPWKVNDDDPGNIWVQQSARWPQVICDLQDDSTAAPDADATFIATARNVWTEMVAVAEAADGWYRAKDRWATVRPGPKSTPMADLMTAEGELADALDALYRKIEEL